MRTAVAGFRIHAQCCLRLILCALLLLDRVLELVGHQGGDIRGLTLTFQKPDHINMEDFNPDSPGARGNQQELIDEMSASIATLREQIDEKDA
jgi:hypothetical protein